MQRYKIKIEYEGTPFVGWQFQKNKALHIRKRLDLLSMKKAAKFLLGTHDFSTFRASSCGAKSPIKTMEKILIKKKKDKIYFQFTYK